jgi:adenylate cyclase
LLWSRLGPLADGLRWADRVVDLCGDNPDRGATVMGYSVLGALLNFRAHVLVRAGRLTDARADVERALSVDRPRADRESLSHDLSLLPLLARLAGDDTDTTLSALEAAQIAEEAGNVAFWVAALEGLGLAHLAAGRAAAAVEAFDKALSLSRERRSGLWLEASVLAYLALAQLAAGDQRAAIAAAGEAVEVSRRRSARVDECLALLTRAQVGRSSGGSAEVVGADLDAAMTLVAEVGALTYEPFLREEIGRLRGDEAELRAALHLYAAIGATGHARRLQAELDG